MWILSNTDDIAEDLLNLMFKMYEKTYLESKETLWFKTSTELKIYPQTLLCYSESSTELVAFIMFQPRPRANKISLLVHDCTAKGKKILMDHVSLLLSGASKEFGWILEASGAVSWVLRKRYGLRPIQSQKLVEYLLYIDDKINESVVWNNDYSISDKHSDQYKHLYHKDDKIEYTNSKSLFGSIYNLSSLL